MNCRSVQRKSSYLYAYRDPGRKFSRKKFISKYMERGFHELIIQVDLVKAFF